MKPSTPLPWRVGTKTEHGTYWPNVIQSGPLNHEAVNIATVYGIPINQRREQIEGASGLKDADYIVHAANAYPKLLECLRSMGTDDISNHYAIEKLFKELGEEM